MTMAWPPKVPQSMADQLLSAVARGRVPDPKKLSEQSNNYRMLYLAQAGRCFYCNRTLPPRARDPHVKVNRGGWTVDHFYPKADGGGLVRNVVFACNDCNNKKGRRQPTVDEAARFRALLVRLDELREAERNA